MNQIQNSGTSGPSSVSAAQSPFFGTDVELMSADYIMWYVAQSLGNIGAQLDDYKRAVDQRRAKSEDIRNALALVTSVSAGAEEGRFTEEEYGNLMRLLSSYGKTDPALQGAHDQLLRSYGGYVGADGIPVDPPSGDGFDADKSLGEPEWNKVIDQLKQSQEALNSDNELTMMKLQTLMQQRNQISQFASNVLNTLHDNSKAIISNIRA